MCAACGRLVGCSVGTRGTPYDGVIFHAIMKFPKSYPHNAPSVRLCTSIPVRAVLGCCCCCCCWCCVADFCMCVVMCDV
jgi:hypothetical protein